MRSNEDFTSAVARIERTLVGRCLLAMSKLSS